LNRNYAAPWRVPVLRLESALFKPVHALDFDEAVGNLLDNACKWARTRVDLSVGEDAGYARIVIEDDGPGLREAEWQSAFERGRRRDEATPGAGLGLSIVQDIAVAYAGDIRLETSELSGLRAVLSLPLATTAARILPR
jgi:signal transduction histidine kinase